VRSSYHVLPSVPRERTVSVHVHALVPTLLLVLLAACARSSPGSGAASAGRVSVSAGAVRASAAGGSGSRSGSVSLVSCSGDTCSVTLSGRGSRAHVLGTEFGLAAVDGDQATLRVDGREVACAPGRPTSVGALQLTCTAASGDTVTFTVARG
jgi:hypothetical protein